MPTSATTEEDKIDGELAARLFKLMKLHDKRVQSSNFQPSRSTPRLEIALLKFLQEFRKIYIGDYATSSSSVYNRLAEMLGLGDHIAVLQVILQKICNNLCFWAKNKEIVTQTLSLCNNISSGYSSGKHLRKVELTNQLFTRHTSQYFPFLDVPQNSRARTQFYNTLSKLLFLDCSQRDFNNFIRPFEEVFLKLLSIKGPDQFRQPQVMSAATGLLRDLRGIVDATVSGATFSMFFDWIYENKNPQGARFSDVLVRIADVFYDVPSVTTPLLKFVAEFVQNKSTRVAFDSSSPNGILLFRLASEVLVAYGSRIVDYHGFPQNKAYSHKYKGIWICLKILRNALQGGYVNFGVFRLYQDPALANALKVVFSLMFGVPLQQIMNYPKFMEAHFAFLDTLCADHTSTVVEVTSPVFLNILEALKAGLKSLEQQISTHCCSAVDHIAEFFFRNIDRDTQGARGIKKLVQQHGNKLNDILEMLFNIIIYEDCTFQWSLSRPMLSLIVINPQFFKQLQGRICQSLGNQTANTKMQEAFAALMVQIEPNLNGKNRDKFTQKLSVFRHSVKILLATL